MSRLNVTTTRKRVGTNKSNSAPRGVLVTWVLDDQVKQNLIQEHFDDKDTTLLGDKSVMN